MLPAVNASAAFSEPLLEAIFLTKSETVFIPKLSIESLLIISIGEAPSVGLALI